MVSSAEAFGLYSAKAFTGLVLPPREPLMGQWLVKSSLALLYADAGVGKSNFALGLAMALAKGEPFLGFSNATPKRVLFVDGEMPAFELQRRLKALSNGVPPDNLHVCSVSQATTSMGSLASEEGQDNLERLLDLPQGEPDVIIIDNKSTLMAVKRENDADSWIDCQNWLIQLRNAGFAVILVHHAGKSGAQRGSSMTEVTPDIILKLEKASGDPEENCSRFVLRFDKNRHVMGKEVAPKLVTLRMEEDNASWAVDNYTNLNPKVQEAKELKEQGLSNRAIAKKIDCCPATVGKYINST